MLIYYRQQQKKARVYISVFSVAPSNHMGQFNEYVQFVILLYRNGGWKRRNRNRMREKEKNGKDKNSHNNNDSGYYQVPSAIERPDST